MALITNEGKIDPILGIWIICAAVCIVTSYSHINIGDVGLLFWAGFLLGLAYAGLHFIVGISHLLNGY